MKVWKMTFPFKRGDFQVPAVSFPGRRCKISKSNIPLKSSGTYHPGNPLYQTQKKGPRENSQRKNLASMATFAWAMLEVEQLPLARPGRGFMGLGRLYIYLHELLSQEKHFLDITSFSYLSEDQCQRTPKIHLLRRSHRAFKGVLSNISATKTTWPYFP